MDIPNNGKAGNMKEKVILCGSNSYYKKYYFNEDFSALPDSIKKELQIMCVCYTEDVGGVLTLEYNEEGNLEFLINAPLEDYLFDEIGSALKIKQIQQQKRELLESLELFFKVFYLGKDIEGRLE